MYNKYTNNFHYKQNSHALTLQELVNLVAYKTGCNPIQYRNGYRALCPSHDDSHPSLSIKQASNGTLLIHCFADCPVKEICGSLGIKVSDLFPREKNGGYHG